MGSTTRPLGGISALTLGVASSRGAAPTLPEGGVSIPLLEDRSTYSENAVWVANQYAGVTHSLKVVTAIDFDLPEELASALNQGFVALIALHSQSEICVGWSSEAAADRALRLVSCSSVSGEKPSSRGYKEWIFESKDGQRYI